MHGCSYIRVESSSHIYANVGNISKSTGPIFTRYAKTGLKQSISTLSGDGMRVALFTAREDHMSPSINLLKRVRSEFIEMPGLRLRIDQAQRLWNLDRASCEIVLMSLVEAKFLRRDTEDAFARA